LDKVEGQLKKKMGMGPDLKIEFLTVRNILDIVSRSGTMLARAVSIVGKPLPFFWAEKAEPPARVGRKATGLLGDSIRGNASTQTAGLPQ
jgi:hypothetical protein